LLLDFDLDTVTFIYENDYSEDIPACKDELAKSKLTKVGALQTDRQTDRRD